MYHVRRGAGAAGALVQLARNNPPTTTSGLPNVIIGGCFCESVQKNKYIILDICYFVYILSTLISLLKSSLARGGPAPVFSWLYLM